MAPPNDRTDEQLHRRPDWFGPVPRPGLWNPAHGADPDMVDFHRWAAGEPEPPLRLSNVSTLSRLNRIRERRT